MEEKDIDQKAIRTYESDIADAIQHQQASQASMVIASEEKKHQQEKNILIVSDEKAPRDRSKWGKNILMIFLSLILLGAGVAVAYYFYTISPLSVKQPSTPAATSTPVTVASVVTPDLQKVLDITGQTPAGILSGITKESQENILPSGNIMEIVFAEQASSTQNGKTPTLTRVTGPQFISMMGLTPPNALTSSLTNQWMFGIYSSTYNGPGTMYVPFIILTDNFFQNAFAGMLSWESTMPSDLSAFFGIQPTQWSSGSFHDKLIKNKNVREFTDSNGNVLFLYSFIDNNTLVIAQNEAALGEIITRFESQAYVR